MTFQFESLAAFLAMDGYGPFVWGAWGLSGLVIAGLTLRAVLAERQWKAKLAQLEQARDDQS
jgi:heme exporter protein D